MRIDRRKDFYQRGLTRTILAAQPDNFPCAYFKINAIKCLDAAEILDDPPHIQKIFGHDSPLKMSDPFADETGKLPVCGERRAQDAPCY